jgi:hypothetical protein
MSDVIALGSLITAICAFVATFWQAQLTREHNRKGTTPLLTFHADHRRGSTVTLRNDGVGPAVLKELNYFVDDVRCKDVIDFDEKLDEPDGVNISRSKFEPPGAIGAGHSIVILIVEEPEKKEGLALKTMERVKIEVKYESVYGEHYAVEYFV